MRLAQLLLYLFKPRSMLDQLPAFADSYPLKRSKVLPANNTVRFSRRLAAKECWHQMGIRSFCVCMASRGA